MGQMPRTPSLTTDCVVFSGKAVVLIRRANEPFKGSYALPGGFVEVGENVETACKREMMEETGLNVTNLRLVGVYSDPRRDPRGHTVSIAYLAEADTSGISAGSDAAAVEVVEGWRETHIAFDHRKIIEDAWILRTRM